MVGDETLRTAETTRGQRLAVGAAVRSAGDTLLAVVEIEEGSLAHGVNGDRPGLVPGGPTLEDGQDTDETEEDGHVHERAAVGLVEFEEHIYYTSTKKVR